MKILEVTGDDYGALHFEGVHGGTKVIDIINNLSAYEATEENQDAGEWWELRVSEIEAETVPESFVKYAKSKIDYETTKHEMWYTEFETV